MENVLKSAWGRNDMFPGLYNTCIAPNTPHGHGPLMIEGRKGASHTQAPEELAAGMGARTCGVPSSPSRGDSPPQSSGGTRGNSVVLTDAQAQEIYWLREVSSEQSAELMEISGKSAIIARLFHVSPKTIRCPSLLPCTRIFMLNFAFANRDIWNCKTWARVTRPLWSEEDLLVDAHVKNSLRRTSITAARCRSRALAPYQLFCADTPGLSGGSCCCRCASPDVLLAPRTPVHARVTTRVQLVTIFRPSTWKPAALPSSARASPRAFPRRKCSHRNNQPHWMNLALSRTANPCT